MNKTLTKIFALAVALGTAAAAQAQGIQGDAKAGEGKVAMCIGCHGIAGYQSSFPEVYKVPKIAGQGAAYIAASLNAYAKGERRFPTMHAVSVSLSEQDIADVSAYYAQLGQEGAPALPEKPAREPSAQVAALLEKGACVSCHGANFAKPIDPSYPQLAGQNADYLFVALKAYKAENNPHFGRSNAIMAGIVKPFTNAELKALAGYIGGLDGSIKTVAESRWR
ncbi:MAG: cytochrome C [Acidovorax sp. SCN 68-22]|nr:MAG: cytochrome C [Acidovorax sp. SCN 68-22]